MKKNDQLEKMKAITNWRKESIRDIIDKSYFGYAMVILIFFSVLLVITATEWFFPQIILIPSINFLLASAVSGIFLWKIRESLSISGGVFFTIIVLIGSILSLFIFDLTWDGQTYHEYAILSLAKTGWNPVYDSPGIEDFVTRHYFKAVEVLQANLYAFFKNLEATKIVNFLAILTMFFTTLEYYKKKIHIIMGLLLSVVLSVSGVVFTQVHTFYVDGFFYNIMGTYLFLALLNHEQEKILFKGDFLFAKSLILITVLGIKGTAVLYFFFFIAADMLLFALKRKKFLKESIILGLVTIFSIGYINFHPFATNFIKTGNPFYLIIGEGKIDILGADFPQGAQGNTPDQLRRISPIKAFFLSYTSQPDLWNLVYKFPLFSYKLNIVTDTRINGFSGYMIYLLYGGIFLLLYMLCTLKKRDFRIVLFLLAIWLSILTNPGSWWARYVPQLWLVLLFTIFSVLMEMKSRKISTIIQSVILLLLAIETGISYIGYTASNYNQSKNLVGTLQNSAVIFTNMKEPLKTTFQDKMDLYYRGDIRSLENLQETATPHQYILWEFYTDKN